MHHKLRIVLTEARDLRNRSCKTAGQAVALKRDNLLLLNVAETMFAGLCGYTRVTSLSNSCSLLGFKLLRASKDPFSSGIQSRLGSWHRRCPSRLNIESIVFPEALIHGGSSFDELSLHQSEDQTYQALSHSRCTQACMHSGLLSCLALSDGFQKLCHVLQHLMSKGRTGSRCKKKILKLLIASWFSMSPSGLLCFWIF